MKQIYRRARCCSEYEKSLMLNLIFAAALAGATITFTALWRHGGFIALVCAPFGASLSALIVALVKVLRENHQQRSASESNPPPSDNSHENWTGE
jgi:hypothetical protein